jgi:hypothetical protein
MVVSQVQAAHSGAEEDDRLTPGVAQVQRITSGVEEGTDLQLVGVERRAAYEVAEHVNTLGRPGTEIELPGLNRLMSQRHHVSTLPATSCMSQAHSSKGDQIDQTNQPLMSENADDDEYLSATSDAGGDFVSLLFS